MSPPADDAAQRLRGVVLICLAFFLFCFLDTSAKFAGREIPALEVAWFRFAIHAVLAFAVMRPWRDWSMLAARHPLLQTLRALGLLGSTVFNFFALHELQLADTTSIGLSTPFFIAAIAGPLLGEWAGPRRWAAIVVGFVGVIVVMAPGTDGFRPAMLFTLGSVLSYTSYALLTRMLSARETASSLLFWSALGPALALTPAVAPIFVVPPADPGLWLALLITGVAGMVGHSFVIRAHTIAPAPVLAPFAYTQLVWMILAGWLVFGDVPHTRTLAGAAIIVASGLYLLYRERVRKVGL
ncbi:DMT family transporter [Prosthecomicrobium pneumaticum]|uniref:Drug/metabolite transporter (DMT)-like permease n=1 Tax=Prosthecomicrobium pneumaticum TaxID=81895 RepID=A0A7W9FK84_9HYPH|nr:DMT family transporter [Prosthecomicrobium pneumaticum]MBB5752502.1 drug/metabolite transporter (DMT)-like permease [Prosthecomicrobium pneumaticum]